MRLAKAKPVYTVRSSDGVLMYEGGNEREAFAAARAQASRGQMGREVAVRKDGERIGGYIGVEGRETPIKLG